MDLGIIMGNLMLVPFLYEVILLSHSFTIIDIVGKRILHMN